MEKSKLSHKITPSILHRTRFTVLKRNNCTKESEKVFVAQTVNLPASVKIRLLFLRRESFERFPLTGWSRFDIQTMVLGCESTWVGSC